LWKELLSGSEIRVSTLAVVLVATALVYLFVIVFSIVTGYKIPELSLVLESLKSVMGFMTAGVIGNGAVSVGKGFVDAKASKNEMEVSK
jgi:hypothetical protein